MKMNTFVLFCCILISGVGFVFAGKLELRTWNDATTEPILQYTRDASDDVKLAASNYFKWYIRAQDPKITPEERGPAPTIPKHTLHAIFARALNAARKTKEDLDVFTGFNNDPPPHIAKSDHGYLEAFFEDKQNVLPELDASISSAAKNFIGTYILELQQCGLRTVTLDYDIIEIIGKSKDYNLARIYVLIQVFGTV